MPNPLIKVLANKSGKSLEQIENLWDETVYTLKQQGKSESDKYFYATVVKILKNKIGMNEMFINYNEFELVYEFSIKNLDGSL